MTSISIEPQRRSLLTILWNNPHILLSITSCLWASNMVVARALNDTMPPETLSFWRWMLALPLLLPIALRHIHQDKTTLIKRLPILALLGALGLAVSNTLLYISLAHTTVTSVSVIQSAFPICVILFGMMLFREHIVGRQAIAILLALTGVVTIVLNKPGAQFQVDGSMMIAVAAMMSQALYTTLLRLRPKIHPMVFLAATFVAAALLMLPFAWHAGIRPPLENGKAVAAMIYLTLGPSILAFVLFNRGIALLGSARGAIYIYLIPVFGTLMACRFLDESIRFGDIAGFALIAAGFALTRQRSVAKSG